MKYFTCASCKAGPCFLEASGVIPVDDMRCMIDGLCHWVEMTDKRVPEKPKAKFSQQPPKESGYYWLMDSNGDIEIAKWEEIWKISIVGKSGLFSQHELAYEKRLWGEKVADLPRNFPDDHKVVQEDDGYIDTGLESVELTEEEVQAQVKEFDKKHRLESPPIDGSFPCNAIDEESYHGE